MLVLRFVQVSLWVELGLVIQWVRILSVQLCSTLCDPIDCSTPGFPVHRHSRSLFRLMSFESVIPFNSSLDGTLRPLLLLPSIFPSIRVFPNESVLRIRWPKYWSFSFNIRPSSEYSGLISFRIDWFDILEVQGTLKSLLQYHSSKAIQFFSDQLSLQSNSHTHT